MAQLGVSVENRTSPSARGAPTEYETLFTAIRPGSGPTDSPVEIRSPADYVSAFGARTDTGNAPSYDYIEGYLREGGRRVMAGRYTTEVNNGLGLFDPDLGSGLVTAPEETPGAVTYGKLQDAAANNNRVAIRDVDQNDTVAAMQTLVAAVPESNAEYGFNGGQWLIVPAPAGVVGGSTRQIPGSAVTAALIGRAARQGNPNLAAAGRDFPLQYAVGFVRTVAWADVEPLVNNGMNVFIEKYRVPQLYGFQTTVAQSEETPFWQANCSIARMWLKAKALEAGEHYMFKPIDGQGRLAGALKMRLEAIALELYEANGLFGPTPQDAFSVEVGAAVNTESTIAQGELRAVMEARLSLHARSVLIDLISVPVTGRVTSAVV